MDYKTVLEFYDKAVTKLGQFDRKGKTMPYTSANGYMFSLVNKDGEFGVRLPKEAQEKFLESHDSGPFMSHGATMKDYVLVPENLLSDVEFMSNLLKEAHDHVLSLPPK